MINGFFNSKISQIFYHLCCCKHLRATFIYLISYFRLKEVTMWNVPWIVKLIICAIRLQHFWEKTILIIAGSECQWGWRQYDLGSGAAWLRGRCLAWSDSDGWLRPDQSWPRVSQLPYHQLLSDYYHAHVVKGDSDKIITSRTLYWYSKTNFR